MMPPGGSTNPLWKKNRATITPISSSPPIVGTPAFVAPECLTGEALDQRADLYALGALCYWTLTRRLAVSAYNLDELAAALTLPIRPPSYFDPTIPPELDELVLSLLQRDRVARPTSAADVIERLTSIAKLAWLLKTQMNKKVMVAASDTFRAAAVDQLTIWADRIGVEIVKHKMGADPAAVGDARLLESDHVARLASTRAGALIEHPGPDRSLSLALAAHSRRSASSVRSSRMRS